MIDAFGPFLALRYLWRRPIMLLGILGVTFAVWALLVVDGVFTGFVSEIRSDVRRSTADILVTDLPHETAYEPLREVIESDPAVTLSAPRLRHHGLMRARLQRDGGLMTSPVNFEGMTMDSGYALLLGIDPLREPEVTELEAWIERAPAAIRHGYHVDPPGSTALDESDPERRGYLRVPDRAEWEARGRAGLQRPADVDDYRSQWPGFLAGWRRLPSMPLRPGDPVDLITARFRLEPDGSSRILTRRMPFAFAGYFATGHRLFDQGTILLPIETLRTLLGHDITDEASLDIITDVAVRLREGLSTTEIHACKQRLLEAVQALLPPGSPPCTVIDWQEQNSVFLRAIDQEHSMMQLVLLVVMLVAGFVIYAMLHLMVIQKVKDVGILAAVGGSPRGIGSIFLICGLVVGGIGALLGALSGWLSVHYLNDINDWVYATWKLSLFPRHLFDLPIIPVRLETDWIIQVASGALLLALVVAMLPARKAARMDPVNALSYE